MSGKYAKKKNNTVLIIVLVLVLIAAAVAVVMMQGGKTGSEPVPTTVPTEVGGAEQNVTEDVTENVTENVTEGPTEEPSELPIPEGIDLGSGLVITEVGSYSGSYVEDGSDEQVSDVLMIQVYNYGTAPVQYAEISLTVGNKTANFTLTTLPVGESMMVLESSRMAFDKKAEYTEGEARNVARFQTPMSLCQDKIQIQSMEGALNIKNVSGQDIAGDVFIYYKNVSDGVLFGGITYRVRIAGGMKAGEVRQVISNHYTGSSRLMFVTCE